MNTIYVDLHPLRWNGESKEGKQHQATGSNRPQRFTITITYLHNQSYYTDPNPSSVCFQRQHQGELCPSSYTCSNSMYRTNNIVLETEGTTVIIWPEKEFKKLTAAFVRCNKEAWQMSPNTSTALFTFPKHQGGLQIKLPRAITCSATWGHLTRCC